jgi:hypothetical protein
MYVRDMGTAFIIEAEYNSDLMDSMRAKLLLDRYVTLLNRLDAAAKVETHQWAGNECGGASLAGRLVARGWQLKSAIEWGDATLSAEKAVMSELSSILSRRGGVPAIEAASLLHDELGLTSLNFDRVVDECVRSNGSRCRRADRRRLHSRQ